MSYVMEQRVIVSLFVLVCLCTAYAQVGSLCRPNERLLSCGCPKTCNDPVPNCKGVCRTGCFCEEGQVRNEEGICVKLADCPPIKSAHLLETTEPRANNSECPPNEEYRFCEPCAKSCENPNPICPAQCMRGCFCVEGLLRNQKGQCVKPDECKNSTTTHQPIEYQMTCNSHQIYKKCETCERTCSNPNPRCPTPCMTGCFCEPEYVMAPDGQCVKLEDCPKAEVRIDHSGSPAIEDCAPNEEYFTCGWCEPSCSQPVPDCPNKVCITGCLCRPPLLRHHTGHCVDKNDCFLQKCNHPNEEFVCRFGCEPRCQTRLLCTLNTRRCVLGCHCKKGLFRDGVSGFCVTKDQCIVSDVPSNSGISVFNIPSV